MMELIQRNKAFRMKEERIFALETENATLHLQIAQLQNSSKLILKRKSESHSQRQSHITKNKLLQLKQQSQELRHGIMKVRSQCAADQQTMQANFEKLSTILRDVLSKQSCEHTALQQRYEGERARRKELHNELVELRGNIRVHCRVRPLLQNDLDKRHASCMKCVDDETIEVTHFQETYLGPRACEKHFSFDRVHGPSDYQREVFAEVKPLITSLLDGYNICIMAYGQTGSGKTYTMLGDRDQLGVLPLAASELFRLIDNEGINCEVSATVTEIYNEQVRDLLSKRTENRGFLERSREAEVTNITERVVSSERELLLLVNEGRKHRATHSTNIHEHSSRSHLIVTVHIAGPSEEGGTSVSAASSVSSLQLDDTITPVSSTNSTPIVSPDSSPPRLRQIKSYSNSAIQGPSLASLGSAGPIVGSRCISPRCRSKFYVKLQLVDLAGSECVGQSGVHGTNLKEAQYINRSLSALSDVLGALAEKKSHIPYRNSVLTHLLQDSIGGSAKMLMFLCVSPTSQHVGESLRALGFGVRARQVQRPPPPVKRAFRMRAD